LSVDKSEIGINDFSNLSYESSLIVGSSGRVLMHKDPSYYIQLGIIAQPVIFMIDNYNPLPNNFDESNWPKLVKFGVMSTARTNDIAKTSSIFIKHRRKVLILVSEKAQAYSICNFLYQYGITSFGLSFGGGEGYTYRGVSPIDNKLEYTRKDSMEVFDSLSTGSIDLLIATSHLDEGADILKLDVCILAGGGKKDRKVIQRVGRVLRKSKTGKFAYIIDFCDNCSKILHRQSLLRLNIYKNEIGVLDDHIFNDIKLYEVEDKFKKLEGLN
jgi:superfamily II DNA/RNA helicase